MAISQEGEWFIRPNTTSSRDRAAVQHITAHRIRYEARNLQRMMQRLLDQLKGAHHLKWALEKGYKGGHWQQLYLPEIPFAKDIISSTLLGLKQQLLTPQSISAFALRVPSTAPGDSRCTTFPHCPLATRKTEAKASSKIPDFNSYQTLAALPPALMAMHKYKPRLRLPHAIARQYCFLSQTSELSPVLFPPVAR